MNRCIGCGSVLQSDNKDNLGYVKDVSMELCERCFRIRHYNEYRKVDKDNSYYLDIIKKIERTEDLVVLVTDFLNLDLLIDIKNPVILVIGKRDLIPRGIEENKLLNSIGDNLNVVSKMTLCSKNNYNLDLLYEKINKYKNSKNVYVIGFTNAGKSTLINKIIKNYGVSDKYITTSNLPSTTLDLIKVNIKNDLTLIDTPGLLDEGSVLLKAGDKLLKKIALSGEIRPITIQVKVRQSIIIEDIVRMDVEDKTSLIFYMSNGLKINRLYKQNEILNNLKKERIFIRKNHDLVIKGLGFVKVCSDVYITLYLDENVKYVIRQSII